MRASSNVHVIAGGMTLMVLVLGGSMAYSLSTYFAMWKSEQAEGAKAQNLTIGAVLQSNGKPISVPVEIRSADQGHQLLKKGNTPIVFLGAENTNYVVKVGDTLQFAFVKWMSGDSNSSVSSSNSNGDNVKQVRLFKSVPAMELTAFFKNKDPRPSPTPPSPSPSHPTSKLSVSAFTANGEPLHMPATIQSGKAIVKAGLLTPFTFRGTPGKTYTLTLHEIINNDRGKGVGSAAAASLFSPPPSSPSSSPPLHVLPLGKPFSDSKDHRKPLPPLSTIFNHWQDDSGNTNRVRTITLPANSDGVLNLVGIYNKGDRVTLEDLGVLQLVSHDLYNTIRDGPNPGSIEDERLNLSTLLDHGQDQIIQGGEPRNSENIAIHTVAVNLGKMYLGLIAGGVEPDEARERTVKVYLAMLKKAYINAFHESLPAAAPNPHDEKPDGSENLTGDLSLRAVHSYVPGHIIVNGVDMPILDPSLRGKTLSAKDMQQLSKPLDGTFDPVFRNVTIFLPPPNPPPNLFTIDLFERDSSFAKQFGTDVSFEEFMDELKDGRFNRNEQVMNYLREDIAAGLQTSSGEDG